MRHATPLFTFLGGVELAWSHPMAPLLLKVNIHKKPEVGIEPTISRLGSGRLIH